MPTASPFVAALVSHLHLGVLAEDSARRIVYVNDTFRDLFAPGVPTDALLGADCAAAAEAARLLVDDGDAFVERVAALVRAGVTATGDEVRFRDGRVYSRDYVPLQETGRAAGHLWIYREVTEDLRRTRALEQERRREAAAHAARTDLLQRLGLAFRTPLQTILGLGDVLLDDVSEARRGLVEAVVRNARELALSADDLLMLERMSIGAAPTAVSFDPHLILEGVASQLAPVAQSGRVSLIVEGPPSEVAVKGDPSMLRQVLLNVLADLIRRTASGRLRASTVLDERGYRAVFEVEGTLRAADATVTSELADQVTTALVDRLRAVRTLQPLGVELVFPFPPAPVPRTTTPLRRIPVFLDGPEGLEKRVLRAMLAASEVRTVHDEGDAEVVVYAADPAGLEQVDVHREVPVLWVSSGGPRRSGVLQHPLSRSQLSASILEAFEPAAARSGVLDRMEGRGARVLVVEDADANALVIESMLARAGHVAERVADGRSALTRLERERWDLVLLDLDLPDGLDGFEVARQVRERERGTRGRVPIVACTAQVTDAARRRCTAVGMDGFLAKPFRREDLLRTVQAHRSDVPALLLVDDAADVQLLYTHWLAELGLPLLQVTNGAEALSRTAKEELAGALVDLEMPGMDGFEVARRLRARHPTLPIILVTGHPADQVAAAAAEAGIAGILTKPMSREQLLMEVRRHLPTERAPEVESDVDEDLLELVQGYLESRRAEVAVLRDALGRGEWDTIRTLGHRLRGSGGTYGFPALTALGARLQVGADDQHTGGVAQVIDELGEWLASVRLRAR